MDISIVIPVFNERKNVAILHNSLHQILKEMRLRYEIIFVDDGSRDGTFDELCRLKGLKIIRFRKNQGQTAALMAGFYEAKGRLVVSMDGDLQTDPADIPRLVKHLEEFGLDVVCGWRYIRRDPLSKKLLSGISNHLREILIRDHVHDAGCTFRVYKRECLEGLELDGELHRYIISILRWRGFKIGEIKIRHYYRKFGRSKYDWHRIYRGFLDLFGIWFWRKRSSRPWYFFGTLGIILMGVGGVTAIYSFWIKMFYGVKLSQTFQTYISIFSTLVGIQLFVVGFLVDLTIRNNSRMKGKEKYNIERIITR